MNYNGTIRYLERLEMIGIKLGMGNIKRLLQLSGNPERDMRFIHIAGTNGKGSTASFIAEILKRAGYKVGLYTSPHLERVEERFMVNGSCISQKRFTALVTYYRDMIKKENNFSPTYFEVTTAIALKYFSEEKVKVGVMEVGLGGRLDATNVIEPEVCVITSIGQDHMQYLGHRLSDIAREKFAIIKPKASVVASISQRALIKKLRDICKRGENSLMFVNRDIEYNLLKRDFHGQLFTVKLNHVLSQKYEAAQFKIKLLGEHQLINVSLAIGAVEMLSRRGFNIALRHIREGLENTRWPGRFEILGGRPYIVLDGAHNLDAIKRLKETLGDFFSGKRIVLVLGIMADKDWAHIVSAITPFVRLVLTCEIESERACPSESIAREAKRFNSNVIDCGSVKEAISKALDRAKKGDIICITGSLYVVGEARGFFIHHTI